MLKSGQRVTFCPYFSRFCTNGKRMRKILQINVRIDMILQTRDKTVSLLRTLQFF